MNRSSGSGGPPNILDRPLGGRGSSGKGGSGSSNAVSLSSFGYLYSELVQYHQNRVDSISELERRLESSGYQVGLKILELITYRNRDYKRETRLMNMLQFVSTQVWKALFGKVADSLEKSIDNVDEYMIVDHEPLTSTFVSVPSDFGQLSVDSYMSGIIAGVLCGAGFDARVTAHSVQVDDGELQQQNQSSSINNPSGGPATGYLMPPRKEKAVFLVKFSADVLERDAAMDR
mmetsp:Transcript_28294/g.68836  ORF Transcript_28294/g.68836 Transcript_28294/m.68836 type:complete len:232 (-) Transcript_28294:138-833(-)